MNITYTQILCILYHPCSLSLVLSLSFFLSLSLSEYYTFMIFLCTILSLSLCTLSGYFDDSNSIPSDTNPLHTLFDSAPDSLPPDPPTTTSTASVM